MVQGFFKTIKKTSYHFIRDALRDLVTFVQFKKREKHSWRSVTFSKVACTKKNTPQWVFSRFLNCTTGSNLHKTS